MKIETGIGAYLKSIGKHKLLTKDQEIELSQKIENGTFKEWSEIDPINGKIIKKRYEPTADQIRVAKRAKNKMIESNLRLVVSIAKGYQNRG